MCFKSRYFSRIRISVLSFFFHIVGAPWVYLQIQPSIQTIISVIIGNTVSEMHYFRRKTKIHSSKVRKVIDVLFNETLHTLLLFPNVSL